MNGLPSSSVGKEEIIAGLQKRRSRNRKDETGRHTLLALAVLEELHGLEGGATGHDLMAEMRLVLLGAVVVVDLLVMVVGLACREEVSVSKNECASSGYCRVVLTESEHGEAGVGSRWDVI